jgi:tellurite methyltransferase
MTDPRQKGDERYRQNEVTPSSSDAAMVLTQNAHLLPATGSALDLACGLGANALFMAQRGLSVSAWDLSPVAIDKLQQVAAQQDLSLQLEVHDVVSQPPQPAQFDVIVVTRFLERQLVSPLMEALKLGGLLFYQTFITDKVSDRGPDRCAYRLARNELLTLFAELRILVYREEGLVGDIQQGFRDEALLVGQKIDC